MATVHPSRLALVPQDPPKDLYSQTRDRRRSPSPRPPRRRSPSPRERERRRGYDRSDRRDRDRDDARRPERGRARADDYFDEASSGEERPAPRKRSRSRSVDRERDREREERRERDRDRQRRASPEYSEYRRPTPPREGSAPAPWRQQENMYPRGRDVGRFVAGGADFMERYVALFNQLVYFECLFRLCSRRQQRENSTLSIWPPSPRAPTRDLYVSSRSPLQCNLILVVTGPRNATQSAIRSRTKDVTTRTRIRTQTPKRNAVAEEKSVRSPGRRRRRRNVSALANALSTSIVRAPGCTATKKIPRRRGNADGARTAIGVPPGQ